MRFWHVVRVHTFSGQTETSPRVSSQDIHHECRADFARCATLNNERREIVVQSFHVADEGSFCKGSGNPEETAVQIYRSDCRVVLVPSVGFCVVSFLGSFSRLYILVMICMCIPRPGQFFTTGSGMQV